MIIHNKIKHKDLREQFTRDGVIQTLESIRIENINDLETKIICRTLINSYEVLLNRISVDEGIDTNENLSA